MGEEEIGNTQPSHLFQCVFNVHSPEPQTCRGSLGRRSSSPSCLQRLKKATTKNKNNNQKIKKKEKKKKNKEKKRVISWPLLQTPERGGGSVPLGLPASCRDDLRTRGGWHLSLALRGAVRCGVVVGGCGSGHVAEAVGTGQGVCHTLHTSGPSRGTAGPSGPGQ